MKNKQKGFIVLLGIVIIAVLAIGSGVYFYQNYSNEVAVNTITPVTENNSETITPVTENNSEQTVAGCLGEKDPYYSIGFGVEHSYDGEVAQNKKVHIVLSCDHKKMTITGAVTQEIVGQYDLADLSSGTLVVDLLNDYDFDGNNDLSSITNNGQGYSAIDSYNIYLYQQESNKFILNKELSRLKNIYPDPARMEIVQVFGMGLGQKPEEVRYKWSEGKLLKIN